MYLAFHQIGNSLPCAATEHWEDQLSNKNKQLWNFVTFRIQIVAGEVSSLPPPFLAWQSIWDDSNIFFLLFITPLPKPYYSQLKSWVILYCRYNCSSQIMYILKVICQCITVDCWDLCKEQTITGRKKNGSSCFIFYPT